MEPKAQVHPKDAGRDLTPAERQQIGQQRQANHDAGRDDLNYPTTRPAVDLNKLGEGALELFQVQL
jgi:hypothetical protein